MTRKIQQKTAVQNTTAIQNVETKMNSLLRLPSSVTSSTQSTNKQMGTANHTREITNKIVTGKAIASLNVLFPALPLCDFCRKKFWDSTRVSYILNYKNVMQNTSKTPLTRSTQKIP